MGPAARAVVPGGPQRPGNKNPSSVGLPQRTLKESRADPTVWMCLSAASEFARRRVRCFVLMEWTNKIVFLVKIKNRHFRDSYYQLRSFQLKYFQICNPSGYTGSRHLLEYFKYNSPYMFTYLNLSVFKLYNYLWILQYNSAVLQLFGFSRRICSCRQKNQRTLNF